MTNVLPIQPDAAALPTTDATTDPATQPTCDVCGHDLSRHDAVGLRFCQASQLKALTRSCICQ